jgi:hypothetical protein
MSEKISQRILIGEIIVIVLPLSLILFFYTFVLTFSRIRDFQWSFLWNRNWHYLFDIVLDLFALLACISIISGLIIAQKFLKRGKEGLDTTRIIWWILSFLGGAIAIAAKIVPLLPPSPERSNLYWFRIEFEVFKFGIPVFIPLTHLLLEKYFRKTSGVIL